MLEDADKYGYQIIRELECRSDQTFSMNEGPCTPSCTALEERGEVRSYERESTAGRCAGIISSPAKASKHSRGADASGKKFCKSFGKVVGGEACVTK